MVLTLKSTTLSTHLNINILSKLSFLKRRYFWFLIALTSTQVSAITLGDFYLNEKLNPILPSQQFSESENSSITVVYDLEDRNITNQEAKVEIDSLTAKILAVSKNRTDTRIYVRGDKTINYGRVLEIMGMLSGSGFTKVALISEPYKER